MRAELLNSAGRLRLIRTPHRVNSTTFKSSTTTVHTRSARHLEAQILAIQVTLHLLAVQLALPTDRTPPNGSVQADFQKLGFSSTSTSQSQLAMASENATTTESTRATHAISLQL